MDKQSKVISTRRVEITDDYGNLTMLIDGKSMKDEDDTPKLVIFGPDGPLSSVALTMVEGQPAIMLNRSIGSRIFVAFGNGGASRHRTSGPGWTK